MKIGIVGTGQVGSSAAYALLMQGIGSELILVDHNRALAQAQAMDLLHATPFSHPVHIRAGDFADLSGVALVILAAGVAQLPGETRTQLLQKNAAIFSDIVPKIVRHAADAILLVATNPLDVMTQITTGIAGLPAGRVFGTGTILDTARLRALLGECYRISPSSVHAYVLGEHGDSEILIWSSAEVAGMPLAQFAASCEQPLTTEFKSKIDQQMRRAAYQIIDGKGATWFGIGAALARLARCILYDERAVFTVCSLMAEFDGVSEVALSLPQVVGANGIEAILQPSLNQAERLALRESALVIKSSAMLAGSLH